MLFAERLSSSGSASSITCSDLASRVHVTHRKRSGHAKASRSILVPGRCREYSPRSRNFSIAVHASKNENEQVGEGKRPDRRTVLLNYVQEVEPQVMEQFVDQAPTQVVAAMRQTITNLLGTLPPQFFTVRVSTVGENLAQLMYSVMMTGYMFRNTQYRMELKNTLGLLANSSSQSPSTWSDEPSPSSSITPSTLATSALPPSSLLPSTTSSLSPSPSPRSPSSTSPPSSSLTPSSLSPSTSSSGSSETSLVATSSTSSTSMDSTDSDEYAPGVQKTRVQGEVLRWHYKNGLEPMPAVDYIHMLESEVAALKQQLTVATTAPAPASQRLMGNVLDDSNNELLEYLKSLDAHSLQELTAGAGDEVTEAMNSFIHRMLGTEDKEELRKVASDCTATELGKLLFWLMVVGYSLRTLEVRYDMERSLDMSFGSGSKELPPPGSW